VSSISNSKSQSNSNSSQKQKKVKRRRRPSNNKVDTREVDHYSAQGFKSIGPALTATNRNDPQQVMNSGARLFFQISLENRQIFLDFSLEILEPPNFPSISVKFPLTFLKCLLNKNLARAPTFFEVTLKYADLG
jgi:hypothetical protein